MCSVLKMMPSSFIELFYALVHLILYEMISEATTSRSTSLKYDMFLVAQFFGFLGIVIMNID